MNNCSKCKNLTCENINKKYIQFLPHLCDDMSVKNNEKKLIPNANIKKSS